MRRGKPKFSNRDLTAPESLSKIVHKIGHEIGNPLTSVISLATLFERSFGAGPNTFALPPEKLLTYSQAIQREAWRIADLNEKIVLLLSDRVGAPEKVDIHETVERALASLKYSLPDESLAGIPLDAFMRIDSEQFYWCLKALFENARMQQEISGAPPSLAFRVEEGFGFLTIESLRTTPAPEPIESLFEPFNTEWESSKRPGLGLTVTATVIERAGGEIFLEEEQVGAADYRFRTVLKLPTSAVGRALTPERVRVTPSLPTSVAEWQQSLREVHGKIQICIIEDDGSVGSAIKKILELVLQPLDGATVSVLGGEEFISSLSRNDPWSAALCDLNLGNVSGRHIFETIERDLPERLPHFGFLTGERLQGETLAFLESSGRRYLLKPFEVEDLLGLIQDLILGR